MKFLNELHDYDAVDDVYYCRNAEVGIAKNGNAYLKTELVDKTGTIRAFKWNSDGELAAKVNKQYVKVRGIVSKYNDSLTMTINSIRVARSEEFSQEDYVACSKWDKQIMLAKLNDLIDSVKDRGYWLLLKAFFQNDKEFLEKFVNGTAAKSIHHNFNGGLLEHTLWVATLCGNLAHQYDGVNRDLLVTAALLHDVGKVVELTPTPECNYTTEGELLGHVVIGTLMIHDKARMIPEISHESLVKLEHCILAHHGKLEYGSPKIPSLTEAIILSTADNLDAKVFVAEALLGKSTDSEGWTPYSQILETRIHEG